MRRIVLAGVAVLVCGMFSGCDRISGTDGPAVQTRPDDVPELPETPLSFPAGINDPYENVVQYYQELDESVTAAEQQIYAYHNQYALYDMDQDGPLELFIKLGYSEADFQYTVWMLDKDGNPVQVEGVAGGAHTALYGSDEKPGFFTNSCHMGSQVVKNYTLTENKELSETIVYEAFLAEETEQLYGYYELTSAEGYFWLKELPIGEYTYAESEQVRDTSISMTLEEYQKGLDSLRAADADAVG